MTTTLTKELATLRIFPSAQALGAAATQEVASELRVRLASQQTVRMIFAAAPSQAQMLHALATIEGIEWQRVEAFHMDEYVGLPANATQRFGSWLKQHLFDHLSFKKVHLIEPEPDPQAAAQAYSALLKEAPIDIVCLGIGMNGHLAFNDPPADFQEDRDVRIAPLDRTSRMQQVKEALFARLEDVPEYAVTLSIPRLLRADRLICCVSGNLKTAAVTEAFTGEISPLSPASILRQHPGCIVFLDTQAAAGLLAGDQ